MEKIPEEDKEEEEGGNESESMITPPDSYAALNIDLVDQNEGSGKIFVVKTGIEDSTTAFGDANSSQSDPQQVQYLKHGI